MNLYSRIALYRFVSLSFCLFFFSTCSSNKNTVPPGILPDDKMVSVMIDIQLADATLHIRNLKSDSIGLYFHDILQLHGIKKDDFEKSFDFYSHDPGRFEKIFDQVIIELSRRQAELQKSVTNDR